MLPTVPPPTTQRLLPTTLAPVLVRTDGSGPAVVLLHANPGDSRDWDAVVPALARAATVVRLDWPGSGASGTPEGAAVGAEDLVALLGEVLDLLQADGLLGERWVLGGNSVGGYAAVRAALARPDRVVGLVLVAPAGFTPHDAVLRSACRLMGSERTARYAVGPLAAAYLRRRTPTSRAVLARARAAPSDPRRLAVHCALRRSFAAPRRPRRRRPAPRRCCRG